MRTGANIINIFARLFRSKNLTPFWRLANGPQIWRILGHFKVINLANVAAKMSVKLNGKFFSKCCEPATFRLAKKSTSGTKFIKKPYA
jgi:hypothetical protein